MTETNDTAAPRSTAASRLAAKRAAKAAAKASRRGTDLTGVEVAETAVKNAGHWADTHRKALVLGGAASAVLALGGVLVYSHLTGRTHAQGAALARAIEAAGARIVAAGETDAEDAVGESYPTAKARAEAALARYQKVGADSGGDAAAAWALVGEGNALLELGKGDDARKAFARALEVGRDDRYIEWRALEGIGFAFEAQGKNDDAARKFEELSSAQKGAYRVAGDYHRARLLAAQGKLDKALALLDALFDAEKARPTSSGAPKLLAVLDDARTLRAEVATMLGKPQREVDASGGAGANTQQAILDALRKQLAASKALPPPPPEPAPGDPKAP